MGMEEAAEAGSSRTALADRSHPVHRFSGRLLEVLDELSGASLLGLSAEEAGEATIELTRALSRLTAMRLLALARADSADVAATADATSTAGWLRSRLPLTGPAAAREVRLARSLDGEAHRPTAAGLAAGTVLHDQAAVIVEAVDALPSSLPAADRRVAEEHLLAEARRHDARALAVLGRRLLEVVDPDLADAELARRLEAEEAAALRATSLTMTSDGQGRTCGRFVVPEVVGAMLRTQLQALTNPHRPDPIPRTAPDGSRRPAPVVLGDAFVAYVERYPLDRLPESGGVAATVVVTVPLETVEGRLGAAQLLGSSTALSPGAARRLACAAGVLPAVLGTAGRVLDQGRRARLATKAQRLALTVEQHGVCGIEDCGAPTARCDAHHWRGRWADGATTDLDDLVLICPRHHTLAHLPGRHLERVATGRFLLRRGDHLEPHPADPAVPP
jgi:hypothetical protein